MYVTLEEFNSVVDQYKINEITDNDDTITNACLLSAEREVQMYLAGRYDIDAIFSKRDKERDQLLMQFIKDIAAYHLFKRHNIDMNWRYVQDTYDRTIDTLKMIQSGKLVPGFPLKKEDPNKPRAGFVAGSRRKFHHEM